MKGNYYADKNNEIYLVKDETKLIEVRNGIDFEYPAWILENQKDKTTKVVGKSQFDIFYKEFVWKLPDNIEEDSVAAFERFAEEYSKALNGNYIEEKPDMAIVEKISEVIVQSYINLGNWRDEDKGNDKFLRKQTLKQLKGYSTYLLLHMDMITSMKKKEEKE